nr:hypothetical protein [uncultured Oscillibacter sp.]
MKKRVFNRVVFALVMVAALCSMIGSVFAAGTDDLMASAELVSPRYATIKRFSADLAISSSGQASCQVKADLYDSYTREVTMYLQDQSSGWQTVKSWSGTGTICSGSCYVSSGNTYRVKGVLRVYNSVGRLVETATVYSDNVFI